MMVLTCLLCNREIPKTEFIDDLMDKVLRQSQAFIYCSGCADTIWQFADMNEVQNYLDDLEKITGG